MRASRDVSERVRVTAARRVRGSASPSLYDSVESIRISLLRHYKLRTHVGAATSTRVPGNVSGIRKWTDSNS